MLIFLEQYGWFFNREDNSFRGIRKGGPAIGYEESIKLIEKVVETDGPFDGIFGFSQGACFVGLLCDLQHRGSKYNHILIKLYKSNMFLFQCYPLSLTLQSCHLDSSLVVYHT